MLSDEIDAIVRSNPKYMEEHTRLLLVGKIKGEERKEDVAKYEDEIKRIWEVSVLVDLPNVHPKFFA